MKIAGWFNVKTVKFEETSNGKEFVELQLWEGYSKPVKKGSKTTYEKNGTGTIYAKAWNSDLIDAIDSGVQDGDRVFIAGYLELQWDREKEREYKNVTLIHVISDSKKKYEAAGDELFEFLVPEYREMRDDADEKPARKKSTTRRDDDDEDDERPPKKSSRRNEDDDDDEDRPAKKSTTRRR